MPDGNHPSEFEALGASARSSACGTSAVRGCVDQVRRTAWDNGVVCAALATLVFSFSSLQVKLTGGRVPVLQLCVIRSSISFCTSIAVGSAGRITPLFGHAENRLLLLLRGLFGTLAIATSYVALLTLPLGDAVTLAQLRPPATAVMARVLLQESLGLQGAAGCLVSVAGVVVLAHPPFLWGGHQAWSSSRLLGTLSGVLSTLAGSGTSYCIRRIGTREPALVVALAFHSVTILLMAPLLLAGVPQHMATMAPRDCLLLLGIAVASFNAQLLMTRSYQLVAAARAAAVGFMGVVYSHALGWAVFQEALTASTLAGGLLIFAGVLLVTLKPAAAAVPVAGGAAAGSKHAAGVPGGGSSDAAAAQAEEGASCRAAATTAGGDETAQLLPKAPGAGGGGWDSGNSSSWVDDGVGAAAGAAAGPARPPKLSWLRALLAGQPAGQRSSSSSSELTPVGRAGGRQPQPSQPGSGDHDVNDMSHPLLSLRSSSSLQQQSSPVATASVQLFNSNSGGTGDGTSRAAGQVTS